VDVGLDVRLCFVTFSYRHTSYLPIRDVVRNQGVLILDDRRHVPDAR
jgi:hypothetical protein